MRTLLRGGLIAAALCAPCGAPATDWPRFRGPNGSGVSDDAAPPAEWSETKNLRWKTQLPGPGASSPIVVGDAVFVTCWSGYGLSRENPGNMEDLQRHIVCLDRHSGSLRWNKTIPAVLPEEEYRSMFAEHGYASHTPVSDGERVYAFLGKSGVYAFDLAGNELWHKSVGTGDDRRSWGTAASPILYQDLLIVPAFIESHAMVAFDKRTGAEKWRQEADGFDSTWDTPVLVELQDGQAELVVAVPYEVWGLNPDNGKLRWHCKSVDSDSMRSSLVVNGEAVILVEGRGGGAVAIRTGGKGDVSESNVVWTERIRSSVGTPLIHNGNLITIAGGVLSRFDAATGEPIGTPLRLERSGRTAGPSEGAGHSNDSSDRSGDRRPGGIGGFGGRGPMGGQDYASPVIAGDRLYFITRSGDGIVVDLEGEPKQLAVNRFSSDGADFSATPAISEGQLFIRSSQFLYCVQSDSRAVSSK